MAQEKFLKVICKFWVFGMRLASLAFSIPNQTLLSQLLKLVRKWLKCSGVDLGLPEMGISTLVDSQTGGTGQ